MASSNPAAVEVSVIIPILNGEKWVDQCFNSILNQTVVMSGYTCLEVVVFNDSSTDNTAMLLDKWRELFFSHGIKYYILDNHQGLPRGVGYAKNVAITNSRGRFLCFQDIDDVMLPTRIEAQLRLARECPNALIGSKFRREPVGSTLRFTEWANNLQPEKLSVQIYTSHGPTIIMPTWFCHKNVHERVDGFNENGKGTPEDLIFFLKHIQLGGQILRVDEELLIYTYHPDATTFSVNSDTIWNIRIHHLQHTVLSTWPKFTVWNAGKQGRQFIRSLSEINQNKVIAICDVNLKKVGTKYSVFCDKKRKFVKEYPIVHFRDTKPPLVICVKLGLTNGEFENNLDSLSLREGLDYILFS